MRPQHPELATDDGRAPALFGFGLESRRVQERLQVADAQTMDGELTSINGFEQSTILRFEGV